MCNLLSYVPRLGGVGLYEASIGLVFSEGGRKDGRRGRNAAVNSFSVTEVNHALLVVSVKHGIIILVVGICVTPGGRRRSCSVSIFHVPCAERHHRFRGLGESGVEHLSSRVEFGA